MYDDGRTAPLDFEFRGNTYEWLGIWVTNLFLTIVTLGIYSAWAKVRAKKYFYQHTYVAGRNFDYHATGLQILIGRIIVIVGFVVYSALSANPIAAVVMTVVLLALVPWLLVRSMRFNAVKTSWANVRFGFDGTTWKAFLVYILYPILAALTLYAAMPFADRARRRYTARNHRLGTAGFHFDAGIGPFYKAFLAATGWVVLVGAVMASALAGPFMAIMAAPREPDPTAVLPIVFGFYAFVFLAVFPASTIYQAFIRNTVFNGASLDGRHRFRSDVKPLRMVWIVLTNALAVLGTMGLMLPWAQVRLARYFATHTQFLPGGSLDGFVGRLEAEASALGDAYTDLDGFDVGIPI